MLALVIGTVFPDTAPNCRDCGWQHNFLDIPNLLEFEEDWKINFRN